MSTARTLVVGAAPADGAKGFYRGLLRDAGHVVAADAAGEWCVALGRIPDVVVGDFDSSSPGAQSRLAALGAVVEEHSPTKDATDLDIAVETARETFHDPLLITAAFTRRIDHTLAAFGTLATSGPSTTAVDPGWSARACTVSHPVELGLARGTLFSVLALSEPTRVTIEGAAWALLDEPVGPLSGRGVSNRATGDAVRVTVTAGMAVVVVLDERSSGLY